MAKYNKSSPYFLSKQNNLYLELLTIRPVPAEKDDFLYKIENHYIHRPDLLSYDLYGTPKLWWVFMQRNLDRIQDPIWDFIPGLEIYVPKGESLVRTLGL